MLEIYVTYGGCNHRAYVNDSYKIDLIEMIKNGITMFKVQRSERERLKGQMGHGFISVLMGGSKSCEKYGIKEASEDISVYPTFFEWMRLVRVEANK